MTHTSSVAGENDWRYPEPDVMTNHGWLKIPGSHHSIYWHEYGTPKGAPVMFLHGGPGGGTSIKQTRFFNPRRYRIVLFDQRGCGKSTPKAGSDDPKLAKEALVGNTTDDLINDINLLREHLGIQGPMHVFGGSWGSTLSLAYAIKHPQNVKSLILRGIFLCRKQDFDYFYQGNAATYHENPLDCSSPGAYLYYPDAWKEFVELIEVSERHDMMAAYGKIFRTVDNPAQLERACKAWSKWEGIASNLTPSEDARSYEEPEFAKTFARVENHYFTQGGFPVNSEGPGYLLENMHKIAHLDIHVVQGRFDQVCPRNQADDLVEGLKKANPKKKPEYHLTTAGHSQYERETMKVLTEIMDKLSSPVPADGKG